MGFPISNYRCLSANNMGALECAIFSLESNPVPIATFVNPNKFYSLFKSYVITSRELPLLLPGPQVGLEEPLQPVPVSLIFLSRPFSFGSEYVRGKRRVFCLFVCFNGFFQTYFIVIYAYIDLVTFSLIFM